MKSDKIPYYRKNAHCKFRRNGNREIDNQLNEVPQKTPPNSRNLAAKDLHTKIAPEFEPAEIVEELKNNDIILKRLPGTKNEFSCYITNKGNLDCIGTYYNGDYPQILLDGDDYIPLNDKELKAKLNEAVRVCALNILDKIEELIDSCSTTRIYNSDKRSYTIIIYDTELNKEVVTKDDNLIYIPDLNDPQVILCGKTLSLYYDYPKFARELLGTYSNPLN